VGSTDAGYARPTGLWFEGTYVDDLPNGRGKVTIDGVSYSGIWHRGCLVLGDKRIAIGVPLGTCSRSSASGATGTDELGPAPRFREDHLQGRGLSLLLMAAKCA
jgi:hypothetical protein